MEGYISIRVAAEKWGVSERRINQYCSEGRIPGAERFGTSWAIPESAEKPGDPRKQKKQAAPPKPKKAPELFPGFMPLINTPFEPGRCMQTIQKMKAGPKRDIALAEYHYFSGQAEKAMQETEVYLTAADSGIRLSACWIFAYSCLTMGRIDHARYALDEIKSTLAADGQTASPVRAMEAFVAFGAAVLLHLPLPEEMPPAEDFLPLLPPGVRAFALYVQAHYLYLKEEYSHSAGIVGGCPCHGRIRLSHFRHLPASGGGDGLHEHEADRPRSDASSDGMGDCTPGRSDRGLWGTPRTFGGHAGGGHQTKMAGRFQKNYRHYLSFLFRLA